MGVLPKRERITHHPKRIPHPNASESWRAAAEEFTRRVRATLGDWVDAIILYGSVARGEATADSDIDVLIVAAGNRGLQETISEIRSQLAKDNNYAFSLSLQYLTLEELADRLRRGSPFLDNLLTEGLPLYDSGSYARIRSQATAALG